MMTSCWTKFSYKKAKILVAALNVFLILGFIATTGITTVNAVSHTRNYLPQNTYLSAVKTSANPFTGLGVSWHELEPSGTTAELMVRFVTKTGWSSWHEMEGDIDGKEEHNPAYPTAFIATPGATAMQYKIVLTSEDVTKTPLIENIEFSYIHASAKLHVKILGLVAANDPLNAKLLAQNTNKTSNNIKIISRSDWGADESLRLYTEERPKPKLVALEEDFETKYADELKIAQKITTDTNGKDLTWPLEYPAKVSKIVIHHTATSKNLDNPEQAMRDLYYWHTITKGWGDIGYNYLIDQQGNIYEGRYGGDGVIGAHAGRANVGSIGIAVFGNYQDNDVPEAAMQSLAAVIKSKTAKYDLDPEGVSSFRGEIISNIVGHRDVMSTNCPGEKLYSQLPALRAQIKGTFKPTVIDRRRNAASKKEYDYAVSAEIPMPTLAPGGKAKVNITLKNTGSKSWGPGSYLVISKDEKAGSFLNLTGLIESTIAGKEVKPGATVTFTLNLYASFNGGFVTIELAPVIDSTIKLEKYLSLPIQIEAANYDYELLQLKVAKTELKAREQTEADLELKNIGNVTWKRIGPNRLMLGTENPRDHYSSLLARPATRLAGLVEKEVKPGKIGHFKIKIKAPAAPGVHREYFAPVIEGVTWLPFKEKYLEIAVIDENKNLADAAQPSGTGTGTDTGTMPAAADNPAAAAAAADNHAAAAATAPAPAADNIKVALGFRGDPVISATGSFKLFDGAKELAQFAADEKVTVSWRNDQYQIKGNALNFALTAAPRFEPTATTILRIDNYEHHPAWKPKLNDNEYRGALEVHWYNQKLDVINDLPLEDYLKGLAETSATEPLEKIRAIIILARSYAYYYSGAAQAALASAGATNAERKFPGAPFDLCDDAERCQKYLGYGFEKRNATGVKAVNDTKDLVVTYKGKIIKTPYFTASDGKTRSAEEVWGWKNTPYLVSVADPGCKDRNMSGHGVGLSGCGALYFAQQGQSYEQIIKYYYKGVEILKRAQLQ